MRSFRLLSLLRILLCNLAFISLASSVIIKKLLFTKWILSIDRVGICERSIITKLDFLQGISTHRWLGWSLRNTSFLNLIFLSRPEGEATDLAGLNMCVVFMQLFRKYLDVHVGSNSCTMVDYLKG